MATIILIGKGISMPWFLIGAASFALYGGVLVALGTLEPAEKSALTALLKVRSRKDLLGLLQTVRVEAEKGGI
jgi:hypothetical protein